ncbi:uncharacterized protein LOC106879272 [Octopus bimaculoides]|uniref:uncharacterized protein LOC106879272 n=1 Tax=Octopus bimaculoides TaxID=37653 RepID=UPI00071E50F3|nr:uncharacterized protein LOC106879272 [Octopus bimaculoides]|eukprot:XP_014784254.1 PREDICTED: uncharacterized protein LOC106879272 [Octopus bimaculoides]
MFSTGCNLTTDNWYTSVPLAEVLLKNKATLVGTMKNKREMPPDMMSKKDREVYSFKFAFRKDRWMIAYVPTPKRTVILLFTMHCDANIDESTEHKQRSSVVTFYNGTEGGVNTAGKKCAATSCSRRTNR